MVKIKIEFEVESMTPDQLHEALCQVIHEKSVTALYTLYRKVSDIAVVE